MNHQSGKRIIEMKLLTLVISAVLLLSSCEKIIELELENAEPVVVIDGGISDVLGHQLVKVSKTSDFTDPNQFNGLSGAMLMLTRSDGTITNFTEISPGTYQTPKMRGMPGTSYQLDVTVEGRTYSAKSTMPKKVVLDSLTFKQFSFFGTSNTYIAVNYNDPRLTENQYRYILKVKGKTVDEKVSEDRFYNGNKVSDAIFFELEDLVRGDSLLVEFQCIDRNVYRYFFSLGQINNSSGPPVAPGNPTSNFSNGALGIFNAHTSSKRVAVIK